MNSASTSHHFTPNQPDAAGVITWVHIGDLHMTTGDEQNHQDLVAILDELNEAFAHSTAFVFLPGDVAEHGTAPEYALVETALERLRLPWCCIVGDHDVHEKTFEHFLSVMATETHYSFNIGPVCFIALNAFDVPDPGSFCLLPAQLDWLEEQLREVEGEGGFAVLLLHCYPSDLKQGGDRLQELVQGPTVRLLDMGHTHYNELANDGKTLYTATRSTGQIEEGPVGFSITNVDAGVISWKFLPLGDLPAVMITSPADERLITDHTAKDHAITGSIKVRAKAWGADTMKSITARFAESTVAMHRIDGSGVWECVVERGEVPDGIHPLSVFLEDAEGRKTTDSIRIALGESAYEAPQRNSRDQDNAISAWPERGLLGSQLGPNKNGRKW